jgi:spermidine synthase
MNEDTILYLLNPNAQIRLKGKLIAKKKTEYQEIIVFDTYSLGRVMLIGEGNYWITQFGLKDEKLYHEAIAHPPLSIHPNPKKVLVIGGGDGGTIREVLKHPIEKLVLAELDPAVIEISKEYFPTLSDGAFNDPRLEIQIGDGRKYVEETQEKFDVVILDLTDPEGPSKFLFTKEFYESLKSKMTENGVLSVQSSSPIYEPLICGRVNATIKSVFKNTAPYANFIQTFFIIESYCLATDGPIENIAQRLKERNIPLNAYTPEELEFMALNPHPAIRENLKKEWKISTDSDAVDVSEVRYYEE